MGQPLCLLLMGVTHPHAQGQAQPCHMCSSIRKTLNLPYPPPQKQHSMHETSIGPLCLNQTWNDLRDSASWFLHGRAPYWISMSATYPGDQGLKGKGAIRKYFRKIKEKNLPYIISFTKNIPYPQLFFCLYKSPLDTATASWLLFILVKRKMVVYLYHSMQRVPSARSLRGLPKNSPACRVDS